MAGHQEAPRLLRGIVVVLGLSAFFGSGLSIAAPRSGPQPSDQAVRADNDRDRSARSRTDTEEERARRVESRTAFRGHTRAEALALAKRRHPQMVLPPAWRAPALPFGHRISSYDSDFVARIEAPDGTTGQLVTSNVPLRAGGENRPVDLALEQSGSGFRAVNPIAGIRLPADLTDGFELLRPGVHVRPVGARPREGTVSGDTLFYSGALTDTDFLVRPTPSGFGVHLQLRSIESPERFSLALDVPDTSTLREVRDAGVVEVRRGGRVVAVVTAPVAWDADGRPVDVSWRLDGDQLEIHVPHRDQDLAYPLLVDPDVTETFEWERWGANTQYGNFAGWTYRAASGPFVGAHAWSGNSDWHGNGLYIRNLGTTYNYIAGDSGVWSWRAPGFTRLKQVEWNLFDQPVVQGTCTELGIAKWAATSDGPTAWHAGNPSWNRCDVYHNQYARSFSPGEAGDEAEFKVRTTTTAPRSYFVSQVGVVYLYMTEGDQPALASGLPDGWVNWGSDHDLELWAVDPSTGVKSMSLTAPGWSGATVGPRTYSRCQRTYLCPRAHVSSGNAVAEDNADLGDMPEGINSIQVVVRDAAGNGRAAVTSGDAPGTAVFSGQGLHAEYSDNADFTGTRTARLDPAVNFDWGAGAPVSGYGGETFSVRWSGYVTAPQTGAYTFQTYTDDGARLWIDNAVDASAANQVTYTLNAPIIDKWRIQTAALHASPSVYLKAGERYRIVMEYLEQSGPASAQLRWKRPGQVLGEVIPSAALRPPAGWDLKLDQSAPDLPAPTGDLWDRRNQSTDHRREGLYHSEYEATLTATEGSTASNATKRSGVKAIDVRVRDAQNAVVVESPDPEPAESCPETSCAKSRPFTLNTDGLPDGNYSVEVTATDFAGNTTPTDAALRWEVTIDRQGDIYYTELRPQATGPSLATEWGRHGTFTARSVDDQLIATRTTAPCDDNDPSGAQCGEVRRIPFDEAGNAEADFAITRSNDPDDPNLAVVSDAIALSRAELPEPDARGDILAVTEPWQTLPPASGGEYVRLDAEEASDHGEEDSAAAGTTQNQLFVDSTTRLPVRLTSTGPDGAVAHYYFTYARHRLTVDEVPPAFFRVERPSGDLEAEDDAYYSGANAMGPTTDRETQLPMVGWSFGPNVTLSSGAFCLITGSRLSQLELDPEPHLQVSDGEATTRDVSRRTQVTAHYRRSSALDPCVAGTGTLEDSELSARAYRRESQEAAEIREYFHDVATATSLDASDGDFTRGGIRPVTVGLEPATAYILPVDDRTLAAFVEFGTTSLQITGPFTRDELGAVLAELEEL